MFKSSSGRKTLPIRLDDNLNVEVLNKWLLYGLSNDIINNISDEIKYQLKFVISLFSDFPLLIQFIETDLKEELKVLSLTKGKTMNENFVKYFNELVLNKIQQEYSN